jgi:hypothetical protein
MKQLFPFSLAVILAACAAPAPQPGTESHQRQLEKEARENFYAMQAENRRKNPRLQARAEAARVEAARAEESPERTPRTAKAIPRKSHDDLDPFARYRPSRNSDDTIYLYDMPNGPEPRSERYRTYKIQYARSLAKRPEDLTPEEREWVRRHYRDGRVPR